ncbi:MAG: ABC transporter substrate-binding protein [Eubacterium sp.]|nr:ABC transporter substrate-binding protein [Eubacterium sp.]
MKKIISVFVAVLMAVMLPLSLTACSHGNPDEVLIFCYGDYMDPEVVDRFEDLTGLRVVINTFDTCEEMYPVIKNQAGVYDAICCSDYFIERMRNEDMLQEIDYSNVPNVSNIGERWMKYSDQYFDPGNKYSVPYQLGIAGIMYNTTKIEPGEITSWNDLWDEKYAGKMIVQDSLRDTFAMALKAKGHSLNTMSEDELAEATQYLIDQKPLVYKYANDSARDLLIGNSADLGVVWNGEVLYSQELNEDLDFVIPEEGTEIFIDSWCIPKNAFHKENAEAWINFMCRPDIAYQNFEYLTYSTPNEGAIELMDEEYLESEALWLPDSLFEKSEILRDLGPDGDDMYSKYWKTFKSE